MDVPGWVLTATIWSYWIGVGAMIVRVRRHTRKVVGVVPEQRLERFMWLIWVPLVAAWCALPWLALHRADPPWALPAFARGSESTARCAGWRPRSPSRAWPPPSSAGRAWARTGGWPSPAEKEGVLITDGMFSRMRHPIYAFSILLMLATMVIVPTVPMLAFGAVHVLLMIVKAHNEERHMLARHGDAYARYLAGTGRFFPRLR